MSTPVSARPLPLLPFIAIDAVLLLTAVLIAWRTTGDLTGGALFGVVVCVALGAVAAALPFVLNDIREREAALAERQRELAELVTSTTATASRWGTQWAAAATGLEDAASLASRSLASAEQLPAIFQEKADALSQKLDQARNAPDALQAQAKALQEQASAFAGRLADAEKLPALIQEKADAFARKVESSVAGVQERAAQLDARAGAVAAEAERLSATAKELRNTFDGFGGLQASLKTERAAMETILAGFPDAAAKADSARRELETKLAAAPAEIEERVARVAHETETRLNEKADALSSRLAEVEATVEELTRQLRLAAESVASSVAAFPVYTTAQTPTSPAAAPVAQEIASDSLVPAVMAASPIKSVKPDAAAVQPAPAESGASTAEAAKRIDTIMDPFLIPDNGYAALADAMDGGEA